MMTSGLSARLGEKGWIESSPNRAPKAICWSTVMSWSRNTITSYWTNASWTTLNCAALSGRRRSTPSISAPMKPLMGFTRISAVALLRIAAAPPTDWLAMLPPIFVGSSLAPMAALRNGSRVDVKRWTRKNRLVFKRRGDHGERPGERIRDAARDRQGGEDPSQPQYLGLPDRRHRDRDDAAAQPHGARFDRLQAARAAQRLHHRSVVGDLRPQDPPAGDASAGRLARI